MADWFREDALRFRAMGGVVDPADLHPCLGDRDTPAATIDPHYTMADLWAARAVYCAGATSHVDVGSRFDGFVTHLLAVGIDVEVVDLRPLAFDHPGLTVRRDDMTTLTTFADGSVESLSCLHAAEHVGLGRYSDAIDPDGHLKAMRSLARVLAPGGRLYFAVPVGRERVCFNAHRVLSTRTVVSTFALAGLSLVSFSAIDDAGRFHEDARTEDYASASYACGLFELTKRTLPREE